MKTVKTIKNQTLWDIALQEYGTDTAAFQVLKDNPHLRNQISGLPQPAGVDFNFGLPIAENTVISLRETPAIINTQVAGRLGHVIS